MFHGLGFRWGRTVGLRQKAECEGLRDILREWQGTEKR